MQKPCKRCNKIVEAKSATRYCHECAAVVLAENRRKAGRKHYAKYPPSKCNKCNKCNVPIPPKKHLCEQCKKKKTSMKQLREQMFIARQQITTLNYQLELYEKMFKAQDDLISEKDAQIQEMKSDNVRLRQYIDRLQKSSYENEFKEAENEPQRLHNQ